MCSHCRCSYVISQMAYKLLLTKWIQCISIRLTCIWIYLIPPKDNNHSVYESSVTRWDLLFDGSLLLCKAQRQTYLVHIPLLVNRFRRCLLLCCSVILDLCIHVGLNMLFLWCGRCTWNPWSKDNAQTVTWPPLAVAKSTLNYSNAFLWILLQLTILLMANNTI